MTTDTARPTVPAEATWRKSSFSPANNCVEVAVLPDAIAVRNSNHPHAGMLTFTRAEMAAWIDGCKAGEFDDLAVRHEAP